MGENIDRFRPYKVFIRAEMVKLIILKRPLRFPGYTTWVVFLLGYYDYYIKIY